jgi:hypothetical protein
VKASSPVVPAATRTMVPTVSSSSSGRQVRPFRSANSVMGWGLRQNLGLDAEHARCDTREIADAEVPRVRDRSGFGAPVEDPLIALHRDHQSGLEIDGGGPGRDVLLLDGPSDRFGPRHSVNLGHLLQHFRLLGRHADCHLALF